MPHCHFCNSPDPENRFSPDGRDDRRVCNKCLKGRGYSVESEVSVALVFKELFEPIGSEEFHDMFFEDCPNCNMSISEIVGSMVAGCQHCYITFSDIFADQKIGVALNGESDSLIDLQFQLSQAIDEERYEDARDIKNIMEKISGQ